MPRWRPIVPLNPCTPHAEEVTTIPGDAASWEGATVLYIVHSSMINALAAWSPAESRVDAGRSFLIAFVNCELPAALQGATRCALHLRVVDE